MSHRHYLCNEKNTINRSRQNFWNSIWMSPLIDECPPMNVSCRWLVKEEEICAYKVANMIDLILSEKAGSEQAL